jgi:hypothetical protein
MPTGRRWEDEPLKVMVLDDFHAKILCHHCGGTVLLVIGYGARHFVEGERGRAICQECDRKLSAGEPLPELAEA